MADEKKIADEVMSDEQLEQVAGGNVNEIRKRERYELALDTQANVNEIRKRERYELGLNVRYLGAI